MNNMTNINPITNHGRDGALIGDTAQITGEGVNAGTLIDDTGAQITAEGIDKTLAAKITAGGVKVLKKFVKAIGIVAAAGFPVDLASWVRNVSNEPKNDERLPCEELETSTSHNSELGCSAAADRERNKCGPHNH